MRLYTIGAFAILAGIAHGYLDASPFFMFSTSELLLPSSQLQSAASIASHVSKGLSNCPSDLYIIFSQPGVSSTDYATPSTAPRLSKYLTGSEDGVRSNTSISDAVGSIDTERWIQTLTQKCGVQSVNIDTTGASAHVPADIQDVKGLTGPAGSLPSDLDMSIPRLVNVALAAPSTRERAAGLAINDALLGEIMDKIDTKSFTVLYTTTPVPNPQKSTMKEATKYEMDSTLQDAMHVNLKRDLSIHARQSSSNQTVMDGPLFEKYQFLSPGIFMGFSVGLVLLFILYVAITGVASLKVTYAAFDKESGQLAQKKGQ